MQKADSTLKKIFADALRSEGDNGPLLAWPVACGSRVARRTTAIDYRDGVLTVAAPDRLWRSQLQDMERLYLAALSQLSAFPVKAIKFVIDQATPDSH